MNYADSLQENANDMVNPPRCTCYTERIPDPVDVAEKKKNYSTGYPRSFLTVFFSASCQYPGHAALVGKKKTLNYLTDEVTITPVTGE